MREIINGRLEHEDWSQNIDFITPFEILDLDIGDLLVLGDTSIVDQDVDLELAGLGVREVVFGCVDNVVGAGFLGYVGLDDEGRDAVGVLEGFG
jgi:hypothetical protein